jgi:hypothetical protein
MSRFSNLLKAYYAGLLGKDIDVGMNNIEQVFITDPYKDPTSWYIIGIHSVRAL